MVFTLEEDINQPTRVMLPKGKQTKQRKNSGTPRKAKGVGTNSAVKHKKSSKTLDSLLPSTVSGPVSQNEMGNINSLLSTNDNPKSGIAEINAMEDGGMNSTKSCLQTCDSTNPGPEQKKKKTESKSFNLKASNTPSTEVATLQLSEPQKTQCATDTLPSNAGVNVPNDLTSEVTRIKQLLLLQVSLISRQQDLLRLRDREIMQLKASNQNYKCQLNRVRRRISTKRENAVEGPENLASVQSNRTPSDVECFVTSTTRTPGENPTMDRTPVLESISEALQSDLSNNATAENDLFHKPPKRQRTESKARQDLNSGMAGSSHAPNNDVDMLTVTPLKAPKFEKNKIPVPLSFIERRQNELIEALIASPPEKALKNFCSIADSPSPSSGVDISLSDFPFKICDRCPHCVAVATEIARLIKIAEGSGGAVRHVTQTKEDIELLKLAAVGSPNPENQDGDVGTASKTNCIMRTTVSYFRHSPMFDQDHWWWDLKCGDLKTENKLNIPTWKEQLYEPAQGGTATIDDSTELTDDMTFTKRHSKYELDERRRKRWDIQRIREYRYNEKLRQKLLKQAAVYEAPVIETFSGHLHDAESVEVHDSLPVNIFGYPAPHVELEEFNITPMYQMSKVAAVGSGRRKPRKLV